MLMMAVREVRGRDGDVFNKEDRYMTFFQLATHRLLEIFFVFRSIYGSVESQY